MAPLPTPMAETMKVISDINFIVSAIGVGRGAKWALAPPLNIKKESQ